MTDDERVKEIMAGLLDSVPTLLDKMAEAERKIGGLRVELFAIESLAGAAGELLQSAERRGMERAADLIEGQGKPGHTREAYAELIRAEAAKLGEKKVEGQ